MTSTALPGANPTEHSGVVGATAPDFGDTRAEFQTLLSGCGLYDLSWRAKIAVTGGDLVVEDFCPDHMPAIERVFFKLGIRWVVDGNTLHARARQKLRI